jgi:hypothetical protein
MLSRALGPQSAVTDDLEQVEPKVLIWNGFLTEQGA